MQLSAQLECPRCRWQSYCGATHMLQWLRTVRMVRRDTAPEPELLGELFRAAAGRFTCPNCQAVGLSVTEAAEGCDKDWGMARKCEVCDRPIARERLAALPDTRLCVDCQAGSDRGEPAGPVEYCPRCGSVMTIRQSSRGVTRYVMTCPKCRAKGQA